MDGPYLPAPHRIGCSGLVCSVAKHHQLYPNSFERKERASFISLYTTHNSRERLLKNYKKPLFCSTAYAKICILVLLTITSRFIPLFSTKAVSNSVIYLKFAASIIGKKNWKT
jgi:hypothetical protein